MRILHVIAGLGKETGGPAECVPGLCGALSEAGCGVTLATVGAPPGEWNLSGARLRTFPSTLRSKIMYSRPMAREMPHLVDAADVVHANGLWQYPVWLAGSLARKSGKPLVITMHGALEDACLRRARWKKRIAALWRDNANLTSAACLHATSMAEVRSFQDYGLSNPVAYIPIGIDFARFTHSPGPDRFLARFPECGGKKVALFLSRIDPHKGLAFLLRAWLNAAGWKSGWHLVVAGPDESGYWAEASAVLAERTKDECGLTYAGPLYGSDKLSVLAAADLFVLPTLGECFGIVVAEALASGTPVITTHGTPWEGIADNRCGWWVPTGQDATTQALAEALATPGDDLRDMGRRGREWVASEFSRERYATRMIDVYEWVLGRAAKPPCVL